MPVEMDIRDEIRLNLLEALLKPGSVQPNLSRIRHHTGFHKATIKSSLDFLQREGIVSGYGPKIDFHKFGYNLEVLTLLQVDLTQKELWGQFLSRANEDANVYRISSLVGGGNWNVIKRHVYKDVESYHRDAMEKFYSIPGIHSLVLDREIFYQTEPTFKNVSRTKSIIDCVRRERGMD